MTQPPLSKVWLIAFGILLGCVFATPVYFFAPKFFIPESGRFNSIGEFRATLTQRDERDVTHMGVSLRSILRPVESNEIIYELRPGLKVKFQGVPVETNSFGMRQGEVTVEKPADTYRIALLGDSFAFGWGVEREKIFATVLEERLNADQALPKRFEVLNFGVPGYSTFQEVAKLLENDLRFKPDLVLVYFIDNDFGLPFFIGRGNSLQDSVSFVREAWRSGDAALEKENRALAARANANQALLKLAAELESKKIPLFVALNPGKDYDKVVKKLRALRKSKYIRPIHMRERLSQKIKEGGYSAAELQLPTDPHPSAIKHRLLGEILAEELTEFLRRPS